jgi:hypothetical protein
VFAEKHAATCRADVKNSKIISFMLENLWYSPPYRRPHYTTSKSRNSLVGKELLVAYQTRLLAACLHHYFHVSVYGYRECGTPPVGGGTTGNPGATY